MNWGNMPMGVGTGARCAIVVVVRFGVWGGVMLRCCGVGGGKEGCGENVSRLVGECCLRSVSEIQLLSLLPRKAREALLPPPFTYSYHPRYQPCMRRHAWHGSEYTFGAAETQPE